MSGNIINLRQLRKRRASDEKERIAEQNRISFGRSKSERTLTEALNAKEKKIHASGRRILSTEDNPDRE